MSKLEKVPGFGASDPTDNRKQLEWQSRYPSEAKRQISFEAWCLGLLLALAPVCLILLESRKPIWAWILVNQSSGDAIAHFGMAWIGGTLGGTLFAIKWLYHVVARGYWNLDRRLWRIFSPLLSGGLAFGVFALIASGVLKIFDQQATHSHAVTVGLSFLVGYFSDSAIAKLTEIADTLFGSSRSKEKHIPSLAQGSANQDASHSEPEQKEGEP
jgi:hypothetical protein